MIYRMESGLKHIEDKHDYPYYEYSDVQKSERMSIVYYVDLEKEISRVVEGYDLTIEEIELFSFEKPLTIVDFMLREGHNPINIIDCYKIIQEGDNYNIQVIKDYVSPVYREDRVIFLVYPATYAGNNSITTVEGSNVFQKIMSNDSKMVLVNYEGKRWFVSKDKLIPFLHDGGTAIPDDIVTFVRITLLEVYSLSKKKIYIDFDLIQKYYAVKNELSLKGSK